MASEICVKKCLRVDKARLTQFPYILRLYQNSMFRDRFRHGALCWCLRMYYIYFRFCNVGFWILLNKNIALLLLTAFLRTSTCQSNPTFSPLAVSPVYATASSVTSMHALDDERRGTVGKAPHQSGSGSVNESGIPITTKTVSRHLLT